MTNKIICGILVSIVLVMFASCEKERVLPDMAKVKITQVNTDTLYADHITTFMFSADSVSIYPNPFEEYTYLKVNGLDNESVQIKVSDNSGMFHTLYKQTKYGDIYLKIDLSGSPKGGYLCDIIVGNDIFRTELLKIKN